ncbi:bifunctional (p)ppGpp synthetase/guanosine-3',5'-bis(diphosphate) 3'-pyrophosphohydrolase [Candidatus Woesearchaeota archaeon]|nr:bifunctional (p)ppGpp synthetase/guanosine-3',5'-bis(diphosphate) 3'-pyrophosphohydrolase [Candidatus Woesearchaeota archaeon]
MDIDLKILLDKVRRNYPKEDLSLIEEAYNFSKEKHSGEKRVSGEDFFIHPYNVALILADLGLDPETIVAGLLHDTLEDTSTKIDEIKKFGEKVYELVEGVTLLKKVKNASAKKLSKHEWAAEKVRKVILSSVRDIRVIFVKLADKLHNARTLEYLDLESRKRISQEILDVYAPLAYKLGIINLKHELENLAFKNLYPKEYSELVGKIRRKENKSQQVIERAILDIKELLKQQNIDAKVYGRQKEVYGVYKKIHGKIDDLNKIYDLFAIRIITKDIKDTYKALDLITKKWNGIPGRLKDYIAQPKKNGYQSIHIGINYSRNPLEIQIRTGEMHEIAEHGLAAHWSYKNVKDSEIDDKIKWLKQVLDWQRELKSEKKFTKNLKIEVFEDLIFVFTPNGDLIELPHDSTVVDFAYAIHSTIGDRCTGAKINDSFYGISHTLRNGDIIEIITSKNHKPNRDWLKFVITSKARSKINSTIRATSNIPTNAQRVKIPVKRKFSLFNLNTNFPVASIKLAVCCDPLPGDLIEGFLAGTGKLTIHKKGCIKSSRNSDKIKVDWAEAIEGIVNLKVLANERVGILTELLNVITTMKLNIDSAKAKNSGNQTVACYFGVLVENLNKLKLLIKRLEKIKSVKTVSIELS